jgi:hypothetical protein
LQCFSETPNKRNKLTMIAEPLEDGLAGGRGMPSEEAQQAVDAFLRDARVRILGALVEIEPAAGSAHD